jgi:hypothetical protein
MRQQIENDLEALTGMSEEEVARVAHYIEARMKKEQPEAEAKKQKSRRTDTRQLSGKTFLQQMRETLQEMFDDGEDPQEIIKAAVGFALSNYHNGVEVGRGERQPQRKRSGQWFGKKRYYKRR